MRFVLASLLLAAAGCAEAPTATILAPQLEEGREGGLGPGQPLGLAGAALDEQTGEPIVDDAQFTWMSDVDSVLGTGRYLVVDSLSAGEHEITLIVSDGEGHLGTDAIHLVVDPRFATR